jgi:uncharacterized protein (TIGR02186 family)
MKTMHALITACAAVFFAVLSAQPSAAVTTQASPASIDISLFYHGMPVEISGKGDPGDDVIIQVTAAPAEMHLKYKGKAAGLFWMKLGTLIFENLPGTYLAATSGPLDKVLTQTAQDAEGAGFKALQKRAKIKAEEGKEMPAGDWFQEFIDFKQQEKLYAFEEGGVKVEADGSYHYTLNWPFQAPPGTYTVETITARNGQVTGRSETQITVQMTGVVATLAKMASDNRAVYGILAILVALAAGFGVGMIFKKGGGAH